MVCDIVRTENAFGMNKLLVHARRGKWWMYGNSTAMSRL